MGTVGGCNISMVSVIQCLQFFITNVTFLSVFKIIMIPLSIEFVKSSRQNLPLSVGKFVTEHRRIMTAKGF